MDPRTKREQELDDLELDEDELPSEDPDDTWDDDGGRQSETLDGMD